jgi:transposase
LSCQHEVSLERLLPHLSGTVVEAAELAGGRLCIWARARAEAAACPRCGRSSARVHSAYQRRLADAPVGGHRVVIRLAVRRFFCASPDCPAVTFAEQIDGLTARRARRAPPLARTLTGIALALAAGPGRGSPRCSAWLRAGPACCG